MSRTRQTLTAFATALLAGCASHTGVVSIGHDTYAITETASVLEGGVNVAAKAAVEEANAQCKQDGRAYLPISNEAETSIPEAAMLTNAYTVTFQCVPPDDLAR